MTLESAVVLLFLVIDPFGNVPFFVAPLKSVEPDTPSKALLSAVYRTPPYQPPAK